MTKKMIYLKNLKEELISEINKTEVINTRGRKNILNDSVTQRDIYKSVGKKKTKHSRNLLEENKKMVRKK